MFLYSDLKKKSFYVFFNSQINIFLRLWSSVAADGCQRERTRDIGQFGRLSQLSWLLGAL